jgi:hypothetical protein
MAMTIVLLRHLGILMVVLLWIVCGVSVVTIIHDWFIERFSSDHRAAWITRLWVARTIWRMK